jgi:biotin transporter BioY
MGTLVIVFIAAVFSGLVARAIKWRWYWGGGFVALAISLLLGFAYMGYAGLSAPTRKEFYIFLLPVFIGSIPLTLGGAYLGKTILDLVQKWSTRPKS